jgi:hypothetical protein
LRFLWEVGSFFIRLDTPRIDFWERANQVFQSTLLVCDVYTMNMVIFFSIPGWEWESHLIRTLALPAVHGAVDKGIRYANGGGI